MSLALQCKCGETKYFLREKGNAVGAYCKSCGSWLKWMSKKDVELLKRKGYKVHVANYMPVNDQVKNLGVSELAGMENFYKIGAEDEKFIDGKDFIKEDDVVQVNSNSKPCLCGELEVIYQAPGYKVSLVNGILSILDEVGNAVGTYKLTCKN